MVERAGRLALESVEINPGQVLPNGTVTVTVTVREDASVIGPSDPDRCSATAIGDGLMAEVRVKPDWVTADVQTGCVKFLAFSSGREEFTFRFTAPNDTSATTHGIRTELRTAGSQKGPVSNQQTILVTGTDGGGSAGCTTGADCPDGTTCVNGECIPEDEDDDGPSWPGGGGGGGDGGVNALVRNLSILGGVGLAFKVYSDLSDD